MNRCDAASVVTVHNFLIKTNNGFNNYYGIAWQY